MRGLIRIVGLVALTGVVAGAQARRTSGQLEPLGRVTAPQRVVAIGDVHGAFESFVDILRAVGLVDSSRRWVGGGTILVQTGDTTDRGTQVRETLDLLMALEQQATASGGRVIALLGNHEAMNLVGDLHDVSPVVYASFADDKSETRREAAYQEYAELCRARGGSGGPVPPVYQLPDKEAWMKAHPPGFLEYVDAFGPDGHYGSWLRMRQSVVQVGDTLFLHGGISPRLAGEKADALSRQVQRELKTFDAYRRHMVSRKLILPWFGVEQIIQAADFEWNALVSPAGQAGPPAPADFGTPDERHLSVLRGLRTLGNLEIFREDGPLWFRGYATWNPEQGATEMPPFWSGKASSGSPWATRFQRRCGSHHAFSAPCSSSIPACWPPATPAVARPLSKSRATV
jgi:hypothetical protein